MSDHAAVKFNEANVSSDVSKFVTEVLEELQEEPTINDIFILGTRENYEEFLLFEIRTRKSKTNCGNVVGNEKSASKK